VSGTQNCTITGLTANTAYYIRVRGENNRLASGYTTYNALEVTTNSSPAYAVIKRQSGGSWISDAAETYGYTSAGLKYTGTWRAELTGSISGNTILKGNNYTSPEWFELGADDEESIPTSAYDPANTQNQFSFSSSANPIYFKIRGTVPTLNNSSAVVRVTCDPAGSGATDYTDITFSWDTTSANCFALDTPILLPDGTTIPIADLNVGDSVACAVIPGIIDEDDPAWIDWTTDSLTSSTLGTSQVKNVTPWTHSIYHSFIFSNERTLKVTAHHPFLVKRDSLWQWEYADNLTIDDIVCDSTFNEVGISSIEQVSEPLEIVSINVEENDTFIANGIVVHNKK
jgi:hypothetical protein